MRARARPLLALLFALLGPGCGEKADWSFRDEEAAGQRAAAGALPSSDHAGAGRCGDCHAEEHATWARSAHARQDVPRAEPAGGADIAIGSTWMQAYLNRDAAGYHRIHGRCFDLRREDWRSVGDVLQAIRGPPMPEDGERPHPASLLASRTFETDCAGCHTSGMRFGLDLGSARVAAGWRATHVDCEACHGPGAAHAEAWGRLQDGEPLARLEGLSARGSVAMCIQCHGGPPPEGDLRPEDADHFVYRPRGLSGIYSDGTAAGQVYQADAFLRSPCHLEGGLRCTDCHDPHAGGLRTAAQEDALCTTCHEGYATAEHTHHEAQGEGSRCTSCHMPQVLDGLLAHQRDHRIGIPLPASPHVPDACTACHEDRDKGWAAAHARTWWGPPDEETLDAVAAVQRARSGDVAGARRDLLAALRHPDPFFRCVAAAYTGEFERLTLDPVPEVRLFALHVAGTEEREAVAARLRSDAHPLVRAQARAMGTPTAASVTRDEDGLELASRLDQGNASARFRLAALAMEEGDPDRAAQLYEQVAAARPRQATAWAGLVTALSAAGRDREAGGAIDLWRRNGFGEAAVQDAVGRLLRGGRADLAHTLLGALARHLENAPPGRMLRAMQRRLERELGAGEGMR